MIVHCTTVDTYRECSRWAVQASSKIIEVACQCERIFCSVDYLASKLGIWSFRLEKSSRDSENLSDLSTWFEASLRFSVDSFIVQRANYSAPPENGATASKVFILRRWTKMRMCGLDLCFLWLFTSPTFIFRWTSTRQHSQQCVPHVFRKVVSC